MTKHYLVTGALGCIGSWVVRNLAREGIAVTAYDLDDNPHRMKPPLASTGWTGRSVVSGYAPTCSTVPVATRA
jgi:nucleoside-diphosphate-sugar epimerase